MAPEPLWQSVIIQVLLLIAAFFFTLTETAIESLDDAPLKKQAESGDAQKQLLFRLMERPTGYLSLLQLERLTLFVAQASLCMLSFHGRLQALLNMLPAAAAYWTAYVLIAAIAAAVCIVLCILVPRNMAMRHPEGMLKASMNVSLVVGGVLLPLVELIRGIANVPMRLFGVDNGNTAKYISEEEIMELVDIGEEKGAIESDEREMIENIFEFNNLDAEDCMIHRKDIVALSLEHTAQDILEVIRESGRTRYPVYEEDLDAVVGILNTRDYWLNLTLKEPKPMRELLRPAYFVPEGMRADRLFAEMQKRKQHMAIVVDEFGGTSGLVTLEDLLEEIVGDIYDEYDEQEEAEITPLADGAFRVAGTADLETVAEALGIEIALEEDEEIGTISGLIFSHLPEIPADGEKLQMHIRGMDISVESVRDRRVEWALIRRSDVHDAGEAVQPEA